MKRTFIHSSIFDSEWKMQKYSDMLLRDIQEELSKNPTCGDIIQSTNGIRKARFATPGSGKSGGIRIFYLDVPEFEHTHLLHIIKKGEKENLLKDERNSLAKIVISIKQAYQRRKHEKKDIV